MPELPEVETVRRGLAKVLIGKKIRAARSATPQLFESRRAMRAVPLALKNDSIADIGRRGKYLLFYLASSRVLIAHMKMTGYFLVASPVSHPTGLRARVSRDNPANRRIRHVRFVIEFADGTKLYFSDARKFGRFWLIAENRVEDFFAARKFAPDALSPRATQEYFAGRMARGRAVKSLLLDQTVIAGIGNIYADEMLWDAKIHPARRGSDLKPREIAALFRAMKKALNRGIRAGGASIKDFRKPDGSLGKFQHQRRAYGLEGEPCARCRAKIARIMVGQRSAHFCPACQVASL